MPTYRVTADCTVYCTMLVEAPNQKAAKAFARTPAAEVKWTRETLPHTPKSIEAKRTTLPR